MYLESNYYQRNRDEVIDWRQIKYYDYTLVIFIQQSISD